LTGRAVAENINFVAGVLRAAVSVTVNQRTFHPRTGLSRFARRCAYATNTLNSPLIADLIDLVEIREGDALETLAIDLPETFDLLLLDGAKSLYADILHCVETHLRPGSLVLADDARYCAEFVSHMRTDVNGYVSVPLAGDLEDPIPLVAAEDIGRIGAETLLQIWQGNRFIEISGPTYYSPNDVAAALEKALDRPVIGVAVPRETWVDTLAQHGMPADRSGAYIEMTDSFNSRWIDFGVPGTEHVKGTIDLVTAVKSLTRRAS